VKKLSFIQSDLSKVLFLLKEECQSMTPTDHIFTYKNHFRVNGTNHFAYSGLNTLFKISTENKTITSFLELIKCIDTGIFTLDNRLLKRYFREDTLDLSGITTEESLAKNILGNILNIAADMFHESGVRFLTPSVLNDSTKTYLNIITDPYIYSILENNKYNGGLYNLNTYRLISNCDSRIKNKIYLIYSGELIPKFGEMCVNGLEVYTASSTDNNGHSSTKTLVSNPVVNYTLLTPIIGLINIEGCL